MIKQAIPLLLFVGLAGSGGAQTPTTKTNGVAIGVHGCTGLTIKDNKLHLTGDGSTPAMDLRNVEDLTERQNKVTWSDE